VIGIWRVADYKRVVGPTIGASEIKSTFSVENGEPRFVDESATCIRKLNDAAFVAREQTHSMRALNLLELLAEAGLGDA
jgi:hypothetical protein